MVLPASAVGPLVGPSHGGLGFDSASTTALASATASAAAIEAESAVSDAPTASTASSPVLLIVRFLPFGRLFIPVAAGASGACRATGFARRWA